MRAVARTFACSDSTCTAPAREASSTPTVLTSAATCSTVRVTCMGVPSPRALSCQAHDCSWHPGFKTRRGNHASAHGSPRAVWARCAGPPTPSGQRPPACGHKPSTSQTTRSVGRRHRRAAAPALVACAGPRVTRLGVHGGGRVLPHGVAHHAGHHLVDALRHARHHATHGTEAQGRQRRRPPLACWLWLCLPRCNKRCAAHLLDGLLDALLVQHALPQHLHVQAGVGPPFRPPFVFSAPGEWFAVPPLCCCSAAQGFGQASALLLIFAVAHRGPSPVPWWCAMHTHARSPRWGSRGW